MGRVYFPTDNTIGVRTLSGETLGADYAGFRAPAEPAPRGASNPVTLGLMIATPGMPAYWGSNPPRMPLPITNGPIIAQPPQPQPPVMTPMPIGISRPAPIISFPIQAQDGIAPAPAVSTQTSPTPTVGIPPAPSTPPLITSGGGTVSPNVAPAAPASTAVTYTTDASGNIYNAQTGQLFLTAAQASTAGVTASSLTAAGGSTPSVTTNVTSAPDVTSQIAAWLSGSTAIGTYSVPNALLAAAVVLGFAWLSSGSGKKR
jgi:hypothetical protein